MLRKYSQQIIVHGLNVKRILYFGKSIGNSDYRTLSNINNFISYLHKIEMYT